MVPGDGIVAAQRRSRAESKETGGASQVFPERREDRVLSRDLARSRCQEFFEHLVGPNVYCDSEFSFDNTA